MTERMQAQDGDEVDALLLGLLRKRAAPEAWAWLEKALERARGPKPAEALPVDFSGASRRMGKLALSLDAEEQARAAAALPDLPLSHWGADEAARALLLRAVRRLPPDGFLALALKCHELGDTREQQSLLRALSLMPQPERFAALAIDACRTNILSVFEAVACENPYPARHFPELNFNQMVLKSLFLGVALARIEGLRARLNAELSRMTADYVSEREAAGRAVPADIWLALAPFAAAEELSRVRRYLEAESADHRTWAAVGLGWRGDRAARDALEARREAEPEPRVRDAIAEALAGMG